MKQNKKAKKSKHLSTRVLNSLAKTPASGFLPGEESREKINVWTSVLKIFGLLVLVFAALIISQILIGTIMYMILRDSLYTSPLWTTLYTALSYALACLMVIFLPGKIKKLKLATSREELGLTDLPKWRDIGLAVGGFVVYFLLAALFVTIFSWIFPWFNPTEAQNIGYASLPDLPSRIFAFIGLILIAPIAEEIIFRGWLYAKLRKYASIWIAVLLVSALFAAAHGTWNVAVNVFAMSIVMCLTRELTGTIWASIILHILKNALAFYILLYSGIL